MALVQFKPVLVILILIHGSAAKVCNCHSLAYFCMKINNCTELYKKVYLFQEVTDIETNNHFLQHLVNSVNKLMVQHAVDVNKLENKLQKQEDAMNKLGNPVDITNLLNKVQKQQGDITKLKVQHAVDVTKLEHKLQKQKDAMEKLGNPVDINNIKNKLMIQHKADITNLQKKLHKEQDAMNKLMVQHAVDINTL